MGRTLEHREWVTVSLVLYVAAVALIVFTPVSYSSLVNGVALWIRSDLNITFFGSGWIEFAANIAMFIPLGFLLTLLFRHPWYGTIFAIVMSAGVELVQIVIPDRQATFRDVISNSIGAAVGAFLAWLIVLRREHKRAKRTAPASRIAAPG